MMAECKHEWYVTMMDGAWCKHCLATMTIVEVEQQLNKCEQLKAENERLLQVIASAHLEALGGE